MEKFIKTHLVLLIFVTHCHCLDFRGKDITSTFFGPHNEEIYPVAYGDFNADKVTDIFAVSKDRSELIIYLTQEINPFLKLALECKISPHVVGSQKSKDSVHIIGVSPGDFNGDGALDVMVAFHINPGSNITYVGVLRGNVATMECPTPLKTIKMVQEPLMLDMNGDNVMDLFGEVYVNNLCHMDGCPKYKQYWLFRKGDLKIPEATDFTFIDSDDELSDELEDLAIPGVNSYVDMNGDLVPELILTTCTKIPKHNESIKYTMNVFEIQLSGLGDMNPKFKLLNAITVDEKLHTQIIGQSLFFDMNQNGRLMHVVPYAKEKTGQNSGLKIISEDDEEHFDLPLDFEDPAAHTWHFLAPDNHSHFPSDYFKSVVLRVGDYNLDGYPDLIGVLVKQESGVPQTKAVLFENIPCVEKLAHETECKYPRTFQLNFEAFAQYDNVILVTFFDIHENGLVDVILVRRTNTNEQDAYGAYAVQNSPDYDSNFMKVMVLSPQKCDSCPKGGVPYGNIISGPIISYETTNEAGYHQTAIAAQMYRSSYMPMDLPYTIFGIGQSPNFIETLRVSVSPGKVSNHSKEWLQIIPNSQIFVVPRPMDKPNDWTAKLFLTPSEAVLNTFVVLLGFCGIIGFIAIGLEYKERRDDRNERLTEANTFYMM